jgi:hypothetical protein
MRCWIAVVTYYDGFHLTPGRRQGRSPPASRGRSPAAASSIRAARQTAAEDAYGGNLALRVFLSDSRRMTSGTGTMNATRSRLPHVIDADFVGRRRGAGWRSSCRILAARPERCRSAPCCHVRGGWGVRACAGARHHRRGSSTSRQHTPHGIISLSPAVLSDRPPGLELSFTPSDQDNCSWAVHRGRSSRGVHDVISATVHRLAM